MEAVTVGNKQKKSRISESEQQFVNELHGLIKLDDDGRLAWKRKLIAANEQRQGFVRIRNWPWRGAAEFTVPFTDKIISKNVAVTFLALTNQKKWIIADYPTNMEITPEVRDSMMKQEIAANYIFQCKEQNFKKKLSRFLNSVHEKGKGVWKVRAKYNIREVHKTLFVDDFITKQVMKQIRLGQIQPQQAQTLSLDTVTESFKAKKASELYPFLEEAYDFESDDKQDKKVMNEIISAFKKGEKEIEFEQEEVNQRPDCIPIQPEAIIVPRDAQADIQTLPRICHEFYLTAEQLLQCAERDIYDSAAVNEAIASKQTSSSAGSFTAQVDLQKSQNEGISESYKESFIIIEALVVREGERKVYVYLPDFNNTLLRKPYDFPHEFQELEETVLPYIVHNLEEKDNRYYSSRGYPERLQSMQESMDMMFNNMINYDIINNTPMFVLTGDSQMPQNAIRFVPGQIIRMRQGAELRRFETGAQINLNAERMLQLSKALGEETVGSVDFAFNNSANPGSGRTASEIERLVQNASPVPQMDIMLVIDTLSRLAVMMFSIFKQRMGRPMYIRGVKITRADLEIPCELKWNGSIENADQQGKMQKSFLRIQTLGSLPPTIRNDDDLYNAAYDWLDSQDVNDPNRYITRPEEQANVQINQLNQQVNAGKQMVLNLQTVHDTLQDDIMQAREDLVAARERVQLEVLEGQLEMKKQAAEQAAEKGSNGRNASGRNASV